MNVICCFTSVVFLARLSAFVKANNIPKIAGAII
jgi:hypothetical protein